MTFIQEILNIDLTNLDGFLSSVVLYNTVYSYILFLAIFVVIIIFIKLTKSYIISFLKRFAKKTKTDIDDIIIEVLDRIRWPFYIFLSLILASKSLQVGGLFVTIIDKGLIILIAYYVIVCIQQIITYYTKLEINKRKDEDKLEDTSMIKVLSGMGKGLLWIIGILFILSNFGVEITPIIASLGIGGIAIAFALQKILEDLFNSFVIYFDKPFKEGDYIVIGNDMGTVKHIGLKTTRIQALQGQELVMSNTELVSSRVNNYKQMERRRIAFSIGVEYGTPKSKMEKIPKIINKIITDLPEVDFDRCHFKEFGAFSLNFEIVYYVKSKEYLTYINNQELINLEIMKIFEKEKIEFAFPTQTVIVKK